MAVALCALWIAPAAHAAFAGENGLIAFTNEPECDEEGWDVWTFDPDTGGLVDIFGGVENPSWSPAGDQLAFAGPFASQLYVQTIGGSAQPVAPGGDPSWSPDGQKLAFLTQFGEALATINVDGTGFQQHLTADSLFRGDPAWSPDGTRIAFGARLNGETDHEIYVLRLADGAVTKLTDNSVNDHSPDWSPDGDEIVFERGFFETASNTIHRMNADGTGVTASLATGRNAAWSPDGTRIAFATVDKIHSMATDGSDQQPEFDATGYCTETPDWQPLPVNTASTYLRPKGATPIYASFVTAFEPCTSANRTHGPPLAHPSCNPPVPSSPNLVISVADAQLRSIGSLRARVLTGAPGGPDDTDVQLTFSLTNVMRASDFSEYPGEVGVRIPSRVTDREGVASSTTQGFPLSWSVPCAPTPDPNIASACTLDTTLDAVLPGAAAEGTRALWALDAVEVHDGGADANADTLGDNSLFLKQGVFVP